VADVNGKTGDLSETALKRAAGRVLENLAELEPELINAGIFDLNRDAVAVSSKSAAWLKEAVELLDALEAASGEERFDSAHVASENGEVFVVSEAGLSLVAVTGRFVLASLTSYDMRMALRDVARAEFGSGSGKVSPRAENGGSEDA